MSAVPVVQSQMRRNNELFRFDRDGGLVPVVGSAASARGPHPAQLGEHFQRVQQAFQEDRLDQAELNRLDGLLRDGVSSDYMLDRFNRSHPIHYEARPGVAQSSDQQNVNRVNQPVAAAAAAAPSVELYSPEELDAMGAQDQSDADESEEEDAAVEAWLDEEEVRAEYRAIANFVHRKFYHVLNEAERDTPNAFQNVTAFIDAVPVIQLQRACIAELWSRGYDWFKTEQVIRFAANAEAAIELHSMRHAITPLSDEDRLLFLKLMIFKRGFNSALVTEVLPCFDAWPSEEITESMTQLLKSLRENPVDYVQEAALPLLNQFRWMHIPRPSQDISSEFIEKYMLPLLNTIRSDKLRCREFEQWIWFCRDSLILYPENAARRLVDRFPFTDVLQLFQKHNEGVQKRHTISFEEQHPHLFAIVDEAAPEDTEGTCVVCTVNFRRVCTIPCGHIVACGACTIQMMRQANEKQELVRCVMCKGVVNAWQPCFPDELIQSKQHAAAASAAAAAPADSAMSN